MNSLGEVVASPFLEDSLLACVAPAVTARAAALAKSESCWLSPASSLSILRNNLLHPYQPHSTTRRIVTDRVSEPPFTKLYRRFPQSYRRHAASIEDFPFFFLISILSKTCKRSKNLLCEPFPLLKNEALHAPMEKNATLFRFLLLLRSSAGHFNRDPIPLHHNHPNHRLVLEYR